jgi:hypothetical protein
MNIPEEWTRFNLGDDSLDPGGSWLYAIRYEEDDLRFHQNSVINAIIDIGIDIFEFPDGKLALTTEKELQEEEMQKLLDLSEELSVTNEALGFAGLRLYGRGIEGLIDTYTFAFASLLSSGDKGKATGILMTEMPQLVSDLNRAQDDNAPLTNEEFAKVLAFGNFVSSRIGALRNGGNIVVISNTAPTQMLTADDVPSTY